MKEARIIGSMMVEGRSDDGFVCAMQQPDETEPYWYGAKIHPTAQEAADELQQHVKQLRWRGFIMVEFTRNPPAADAKFRASRVLPALQVPDGKSVKFSGSTPGETIVAYVKNDDLSRGDAIAHAERAIQNTTLPGDWAAIEFDRLYFDV
jgi:hypothetical protein